ncbi:MAG: hypothetical protein GW858_13645 [Sphingomonadales bacterium]|nr:hypothetical protein [Sphingomonadales bacterium]NCQ22290.1 hypothetical protein [Sphingomonadales bacterium]NCT04715.1 hypothetical protein [Sphingomonadales bacterium]
MALKIHALAFAGALAGTTMIAAPAAAAPVSAPLALGTAPVTSFDFSRYDPLGATADWRGCRWNCGYGRHRGWRRNRVGAGDVLIGAAILGGVAAILSSNNRRERDRDVVIVDRDLRDREWRTNDPRYDDRRYDDRRYNDRRVTAPRGTGASGLDNAVNQCIYRIERDVRVDTVENVERTGAGWLVSGVLFNGSSFQCRIGNSGQIDAIDYDRGFGGAGYSAAPLRSSGSQADTQWDNQRYASARAAVGGTVRPDIAVQESLVPSAVAAGAPYARTTTTPATSTTPAMPAYPGGPIPGEVIPETIDGAI